MFEQCCGGWITSIPEVHLAVDSGKAKDRYQ